MSIQAWLMVIGVSAMTLIVWDGWRRKTRQRVAAFSAPIRSDAYEEVENPEVESASEPLVPQAVALQAVGEQQAQADMNMTKALVSHEAGSRIGAATYLKGNITAREPVLIKGHVQGVVNASGFPVIVSSTGQVASHVEGSCIDIDGLVTGMLKATIKLNLLSQARVEGRIEAPTVECAAGAWLQAKVTQGGIRQDTQ